ncbi:unnamed protein product [Prunus brigantina]
MLEEASATGESILRKYAEQRDWLKVSSIFVLTVMHLTLHQLLKEAYSYQLS